MTKARGQPPLLEEGRVEVLFLLTGMKRTAGVLLKLSSRCTFCALHQITEGLDALAGTFHSNVNVLLVASDIFFLLGVSFLRP